MSLRKIASIHRSCDPHKMRVEPWRYEEQRLLFYHETGILLPEKKDLELVGKLKELRILLNEVVLTIVAENSRWLQYKFKVGFAWDLASVPKPFRGILDNDDIYIQDAVLPHDVNYSQHFLDIDDTNDLFYGMIRHRGKRLKARIAHTAVNSIIGRSLYYKLGDRRKEVTSRFVEFASSDLRSN